jgi:ATP-dependent Clp protease ATP-binding subunit ClpA
VSSFFDEVEKAHLSVFNVFLQLMDDGMLSDGLGRTIDIKNIMTSDLGEKHLMSTMTNTKIIKVAQNLLMK